SIEALRTWLRAGFHASHSATPHEAEMSPKTSGRGCSVSYLRLGRHMSSRKTSRGRVAYGLESGAILKPRDTESAGRFVLDRPTWAAQILVHGSGWLPRPTRTANQCSPSMMKHPGCRNLLALAPGGVLTPALWEWQMGWPIGWTGLQPLETVKFQQWLRA